MDRLASLGLLRASVARAAYGKRLAICSFIVASLVHAAQATLCHHATLIPSAAGFPWYRLRLRRSSLESSIY